MNKSIGKDSCTGCATCQNICPNNCISMVMDKEGFLFPKVDEEKCTKCNECKRRCPAITRDNLSEIDIVKEYPTFVGYSKDQNVIDNCTSGGAFYELSRFIIQNNQGIVYGAAYDKKFHVRHERIDSMEQYHRISGSKYVQSEIGMIFRRVKEDLVSGKMVLFSGCGCQIVALKSYLGKEFENLLTVAIVCHGVPSPGVWDSYISKFRNVLKINFRDKSKEDWCNYSFSITTGDKEYTWKEDNNPYTYSFIKDIIIRKSCFECKFKSYRCDADVMIGDAWGIQNYCRKSFNPKGTSLIIIYTEKGRSIISRIYDRMKLECVSGIDVYRYNPRIVKSIELKKLRHRFSKLSKFFSWRICLRMVYKSENR